MASSVIGICTAGDASVHAHELHWHSTTPACLVSEGCSMLITVLLDSELLPTNHRLASSCVQCVALASCSGLRCIPTASER